MIRNLIAAALLALASGCASVSPSVPPTEKLDPQAAYLYGDYVSYSVGGGGVALEFVNRASPDKYLAKFRKDRRLVVTKIKPGTYTIKRMVAVAPGNQFLGARELAGAPFDTAFEAKAGHAYYTGHFVGNKGMSSGSLYWSVGIGADRFAQATQQFKERYPELQALPADRAFEPISDSRAD